MYKHLNCIYLYITFILPVIALNTCIYWKSMKLMCMKAYKWHSYANS